MGIGDQPRIGPYAVIAKLAEDATTQSWICGAIGPSGENHRVFVCSLRPEYIAHPQVRSAFLEAARVGSLLAHDHIPHIEEIGEHDSIPFTVQAYIEGPSAAQIIARQRWRGQFDLRLAARMVLDVAEALEHAHAAVHPGGQPLRVVHGRITPASILVSASGKTALVGFRPPADPAPDALPYLAPETLLHGVTSHSTDLFALGVVLHQLCVSEHPWAPDVAVADPNTGAIRAPNALPGIPEALDHILARALALDPSQRYPRAADMARDLRGWLQSQRPMGDADVVAVVQELFPEGPQGWATVQVKPPAQGAAPWRVAAALMGLVLVGVLVLAVGAGLVSFAVLLKEPATPAASAAPAPLQGPGLEELRAAGAALDRGDLALASDYLHAAQRHELSAPLADLLQTLEIRLHVETRGRSILTMIAVDPEEAMRLALELNEAFPGEGAAMEVLQQAEAAMAAKHRASRLSPTKGSEAPPSAKLKITGPSTDAKVYVDQVLVGTVPVDLRISPGRHHVTVMGPTRELYNAPVELQEGHAFQLDLSP